VRVSIGVEASDREHVQCLWELIKDTASTSAKVFIVTNSWKNRSHLKRHCRAKAIHYAIS